MSSTSVLKTNSGQNAKGMGGGGLEWEGKGVGFNALTDRRAVSMNRHVSIAVVL